MKLRSRRSRFLVEPATSATSDIAFNLIIFFLICASTQPGSGRPQDLPNSEQQEQEQQEQNVEVSLIRDRVEINGRPIADEDFVNRLRIQLGDKTDPADRIVLVKSSKDTSYEYWVHISAMIDQAGGVVTLQLEDKSNVMVSQ